MKRNKYYFPIALLTLVLVSCSPENKVQNGTQMAVPVTVSKVISSDITYYDEYPGTVNALNQIDIKAQVNGYVTKINFEEGKEVQKGQLLYSIDADVYQANYQKAKSELQIQEANLVKVQQDAERYHELDKHNAIAKQVVEHADAALEVAKKQVAAAKSNVANLRSILNFANIYAPFSGTIGISKVKIGSAVVTGQTILNTISSDHPIAVDFTIDQKNIYRFTQLQQSKSIIADSVFTLVFGDDIYPESGKISIIDRAVDPQTGTIKVRLVFKNEKNMLKPGMNTVIRVKNENDNEHLLIPYKAVTEVLGEFRVYVVGDNSKVSQRLVKLGRQVGDNVIIDDGLKVGETIVVEGVQNLHEGSTVKVSNNN